MEDFDRERWRGRVDARMDNMESDIASAHAKNERLDAKLQLTDLVVAKVATRIGVWATGGAIVGGGLVTMLLKLVFK